MDSNFIKMPKRKPLHKRRGKKQMFWSPFGSGKPTKAGQRYYRRQVRRVKRDMSL